MTADLQKLIEQRQPCPAEITGPFAKFFVRAARYPGPSHFSGGLEQLSPEGQAFLDLATAGVNLNTLPKKSGE